MQLEDRKGLIALLVLLSVYLGYVMFAAFGPENVRSARAFGALIAAVGSVFIALALLETFFEPGFPDWLFGGSPLATGLFGALGFPRFGGHLRDPDNGSGGVEWDHEGSSAASSKSKRCE